MNEFLAQFDKIKNKYTDVLFGFCKTNFSSFYPKYKSAIVFAIPHKNILTLNNYKETDFENIILNAMNDVDIILKDIIYILEKYDIKYYIPKTAQENEKDLLAEFSFKFAGVQAGLGWIEKNGVLITEKYGPRVRLSTILLEIELPFGNPTTTSHCPPHCSVCVSACPYKLISGCNWDITKTREDLIDYQTCNKKRSEYIKTHNRKNSCGLCLVSCPMGT